MYFDVWSIKTNIFWKKSFDIYKEKFEQYLTNIHNSGITFTAFDRAEKTTYYFWYKSNFVNHSYVH